MNFFNENKNTLEIGFFGEGLIRDLLKSRGIKFMQVDVLYYKEGNYYIGEVKTQEIFTSPPFDGHGLPPYQLDARYKIELDTGITSVLFIVCLTNNVVYFAKIKDLIKLKTEGINDIDYAYTKSGKRIIFPINKYKVVKELDYLLKDKIK